jgi:ABC-2 type transport system permease protein
LYRWWKPYLGIFRMRLIAGMQYRAAAWAGVATQFFWGAMQLIVFYTFYRGAGLAVLQGEGPAGPLSFRALADLVWLRQSFLALVMLWATDNELLEIIASGNVAYELCRPFSLYVFWFARILAYRISRTLLRCVPILLICSFLPEPYGFHLPPDLQAALCFIPAIAMAALLTTALSLFGCLITFKSLSPYAGRLFLGAVGEFLMGAIIPIPFMPPLMRSILGILPFRYTADFPFRVWSGDIAGAGALAGLAMQFLWLALLVSLGLWGFRAALRRVVVQGG